MVNPTDEWEVYLNRRLSFLLESDDFSYERFKKEFTNEANCRNARACLIKEFVKGIIQTGSTIPRWRNESDATLL